MALPSELHIGDRVIITIQDEPRLTWTVDQIGEDNPYVRVIRTVEESPPWGDSNIVLAEHLEIVEPAPRP